jgi:hypothetical protein
MILELLVLEARVALIPQEHHGHAEYVLNDSHVALIQGVVHGERENCDPGKKVLCAFDSF